MFYGMRHAWHVALVAEVSHIAVEGGASLVGVGIVDKQDLELVLESNDAVAAIVEGGRFELVRDALDGTGHGSPGGKLGGGYGGRGVG